MFYIMRVKRQITYMLYSQGGTTYEAVLYEKASGEVPVEEFLDAPPVKLREKTLRTLRHKRDWEGRQR